MRETLLRLHERVSSPQGTPHSRTYETMFVLQWEFLSWPRHNTCAQCMIIWEYVTWSHYISVSLRDNSYETRLTEVEGSGSHTPIVLRNIHPLKRTVHVHSPLEGIVIAIHRPLKHFLASLSGSCTSPDSLRRLMFLHQSILRYIPGNHNSGMPFSHSTEGRRGFAPGKFDSWEIRTTL